MRVGGEAERPDPPDLLPILSPLRPVLRCNIGDTNSYDCPLPALADTCSANLECVATPPSRSRLRNKYDYYVVQEDQKDGIAGPVCTRTVVRIRTREAVGRRQEGRHRRTRAH